MPVQPPVELKQSPRAPQRSDPGTYAEVADAFVDHIAQLPAELDRATANVHNNALEAQGSAEQAARQAQAAGQQVVAAAAEVRRAQAAADLATANGQRQVQNAAAEVRNAAAEVARAAAEVTKAADAAIEARQALAAAELARDGTRVLAAAAGSAAGLPSMRGKGGMALVVSDREDGADWRNPAQSGSALFTSPGIWVSPITGVIRVTACAAGADGSGEICGGGGAWFIDREFMVVARQTYSIVVGRKGPTSLGSLFTLAPALGRVGGEMSKSGKGGFAGAGGSGGGLSESDWTGRGGDSLGGGGGGTTRPGDYRTFFSQGAPANSHGGGFGQPGQPGLGRNAVVSGGHGNAGSGGGCPNGVGGAGLLFIQWGLS